MRTIRTRTAIAATAALLAGLSLTACQGDDKAKATDPAGGGKASATASEAPAATPPSGTGGGTASAAPAGGSSDASPVTCTGDNTKVVASKLTRPINHLLITVTNTGSRPCNAFGAPYLRFDEAQSPTQFVEDSKPQAVVTLDPGQSAYASVTLTGEPGKSKGRTAKHLTVSFDAGSGSGSTGAHAEVTLPADTYIEDDSAMVTYWLSDMSDALTY
ncbi:DUF4232 domain-containing protein [Streptomyces sp. NPDC059909]|uniref:DUF4232 domain-containing protein n=1 Tax=Streptomyces sp. NPDC059909 TaxID=3346998 RepID=UPI0036543D70